MNFNLENFILYLVIVALVLFAYFLRRHRKETVNAHLTAINMVIGLKLLEKYEPGQYLYHRQIEDIRDAIFYSCKFKEIEQKSFEQLIISLESEKSLNQEEVERLSELFDIKDAEGE
ncbi:hypothetical protein M5X00_24205 [Paenibacillus alvei]|uniref:Uncharacterized protein n=1 Tax=Paenibacillus alvei TaxID=44250 RepID=A0ABT4GR49_PAEAL|nr:hypothetical protein [Paenibacillus alvei]MCY9543624.1 hypothetical protein [Paenibacillus alvei]MCY9736121.1 hypothetical protein [Paenibacillus alvei]MCY9757333.1 hypothetical protein [Paenibacillus alvei]MCY9759135.1 hypothetical protein [Paenibacillus alvei]MCY9770406.1 hypothetical protein [Paenibacillus alvei]